MMKIAGLSHLFKWENLHNWWLTKYFFVPLYMCVCPRPTYTDCADLEIGNICLRPLSLL